MSERTNAVSDPDVPRWLWYSIGGLLLIVLVAGLGLAGALALGWRSSTPRRAPDLTGADLIWTPYGDGIFTGSDGSYVMRLSRPYQRVWAVGAPSITDFDAELDLRATYTNDDIGYGMTFRYQNPENHYFFAIGSDGYYTISMVRYGELTSVHPWQQWPHVRQGNEPNRLRVRCEGSICQFYINGEFVGEVGDVAFLSGNLGVWAQNYSNDNLKVTFEGIKLWSLK